MVSRRACRPCPRSFALCKGLAGPDYGCSLKILFDTNTPAPLAHALRPHKVTLSVDVGWDRLENGSLLSAAEAAGFDVLISCDQNIPYQQNFTDRKIAVIILSTNRW